MADLFLLLPWQISFVFYVCVQTNASPGTETVVHRREANRSRLVLDDFPVTGKPERCEEVVAISR